VEASVGRIIRKLNTVTLCYLKNVNAMTILSEGPVEADLISVDAYYIDLAIAAHSRWTHHQALLDHFCAAAHSAGNSVNDVFLSRFALNSADTAFCSFSVSTR
jgi:hypothetical protein